MTFLLPDDSQPEAAAVQGQPPGGGVQGACQRTGLHRLARPSFLHSPTGHKLPGSAQKVYSPGSGCKRLVRLQKDGEDRRGRRFLALITKKTNKQKNSPFLSNGSCIMSLSLRGLRLRV